MSDASEDVFLLTGLTLHQSRQLCKNSWSYPHPHSSETLFNLGHLTLAIKYLSVNLIEFATIEFVCHIYLKY